MNSNFLTLDWKDVVKGLVVAVLTAVLTALLNVFNSGAMPTPADLKAIGIIALTAGLSYILKNWLTNSSGEILKKDIPNG